VQEHSLGNQFKLCVKAPYFLVIKKQNPPVFRCKLAQILNGIELNIISQLLLDRIHQHKSLIKEANEGTLLVPQTNGVSNFNDNVCL
jgi:hypothetical protein